MKTVKDYNIPLNSQKHKQQQHEKISTVLFYQVCAGIISDTSWYYFSAQRYLTLMRWFSTSIRRAFDARSIVC